MPCQSQDVYRYVYRVLWSRDIGILFAPRLFSRIYRSRSSRNRRTASARKTSLMGGVFMKIVLVRPPTFLSPIIKKFFGIRKVK